MEFNSHCDGCRHHDSPSFPATILIIAGWRPYPSGLSAIPDSQLGPSIFVRLSSISVAHGVVPAVVGNSNQSKKKVFRARDDGKI